jgi:Trk K+ transport system NAD-binding subunit
MILGDKGDCMKKPSLREKLRYAFDNYMGKGTIALIGMLFLITAAVVVISGILSHVVNHDSSAGSYMWTSLMHTIDSGTLAGDDTSRAGYLFLMSVVTICGIFVTSILIGIISSGFEEKLNSLKKGFSRVIESDHTVIIGFNDGIYTIVSELIEANANQKAGRILIIGTQDKEEMDIAIHDHISDFKTTRVICRSGNPVHPAVLEMSSVETARSVIINADDDFTVIKTILSVISYFKEKNAFGNKAYITAMIHDRKNLDAARIAGEGKAEIIYFRDMIARVVANTCRQPGLSSVLTDMFDFGGAEFYYENFPELAGKRFGDVLNMFRYSVVVGICRDDVPMLNPPMDTVLTEKDRIIHFAEDDGVSKPSRELPETDADHKRAEEPYTENREFSMLILGYNDSLTLILRELADYLAAGSRIIIACDSLSDEEKSGLDCPEDLDVSIETDDIYDKDVLEKLVSAGIDNVLLLSDSRVSDEEADSQNLLLLLQLRDIQRRRNIELNITSEMNSTENQRLMKVTKVNDFVIGSSITNLIMTQISENRHLAELFKTLLTAEGSELYMKNVRNYLKPGIPVSYYEVTELVSEHNEIFMGYRRKNNGILEIVTNPDKSQTMTFGPDDCLIVIAED